MGLPVRAHAQLAATPQTRGCRVFPTITSWEMQPATASVSFPSLHQERRVAAPARWWSSLPFARSASIALACFASCGDVSAPASAGEVKKAEPRQTLCCWLSQPPPPSKPSGLFSIAICGNKQQIKSVGRLVFSLSSQSV